jgi:hypothetical protein
MRRIVTCEREGQSGAPSGGENRPRDTPDSPQPIVVIIHVSGALNRLAVAAVFLGAIPTQAVAQTIKPGTVRVDGATSAPAVTVEPPLNVLELKPGGFETSGTLTAGPWTLTTKTAWDSRDPQRQISARLAYETRGGLRLSAGVTGRQRYLMPLAVAQPLGSDGVVREAGFSLFEPVDRTMLWETQIRMEKVLKDGGALHIRAVGELFNLFDASTLFGGDRAKAGKETSTRLRTSKSARFGLMLGF